MYRVNLKILNTSNELIEHDFGVEGLKNHRGENQPGAREPAAPCFELGSRWADYHTRIGRHGCRVS